MTRHPDAARKPNCRNFVQVEGVSEHIRVSQNFCWGSLLVRRYRSMSAISDERGCLCGRVASIESFVDVTTDHICSVWNHTYSFFGHVMPKRLHGGADQKHRFAFRNVATLRGHICEANARGSFFSRSAVQDPELGAYRLYRIYRRLRVRTNQP